MIRNNEKITNTEKPCVSVILPIYNMERYLPACLDSIIGQTHREIEIICVNDGSTDASMAILREYEAADSRIQIIDQENQGLSVSRNKGAEIAGGKYLYFMDSDDLLEPDALELCVEKMERLDLELVCFNAASFAESPEKSGVADIQNKSYFDRTLNEEKMYSGQELFVDLKQRRAYVVPVWTCVISRSAFLKHHLWFHPGIIHEDKPWMFATMMSLSRCGCINRILYRRRVWSGSITQTKRTLRNSYGVFAGTLDMRRMLVETPDLILDDNYRDAAIDYIVASQKMAVNQYRGLDEEEKQNRRSMDFEERILFEQMVVYPAAQADTIEKQKKEIRDLKQKHSAQTKEKDSLTRENNTLKQEKKQLKRRNKKIKSSTSYRLGRMLTWAPRKVKSLFR